MVFVKAQELAVYTTRICSNEKVFLPQYYNSMTKKLMDLAQDIYIESWSANNIMVNDADTYNERLKLQREAHRKCNELLALIQLAKPPYHLSAKRVKYWGDMVVDVRNLIYKWKESDIKRNKEWINSIRSFGMKIKKLKMSIADSIKLEQTMAELEKANATIEYISMMADIEIPTDEEDGEFDE